MIYDKDRNPEEDYNGLGMASPTHIHRFIQRKIVGNYQKKSSWRESIKLLYEQAVDGPNGREIEPDISYWGSVVETPEGDDVELDNLLLVIEVVHTKDNWNYSRDRILDAFDFKETMTEGFIYDYEKKQWWRFRRDSDGEIYMEENKDYSSVLGLYLHTLVKL